MFKASNTQKKVIHTNEDDLFAENSPKNKPTNFDDDDLFANNDSKPKSNTKVKIDMKDDNDFFGEDSGDKNDDSDDPFADKHAPKVVTKEPKLKHMESMTESGDLFLKEIKQQAILKAKICEKTNSRYFGELKDVESMYTVRHKSLQQIKTIHKYQQNAPFEVVQANNEVIKMQEKAKFEEIRNKNFIETKIFENLSLYKFRNKKLDSDFKLTLLTPDDKLKSKQLVLDIDKKKRDMKFEFEENMNKLYDADIREIVNDLQIKMRKEYEEKHGHEMQLDDPMMQLESMDENSRQQKGAEENDEKEAQANHDLMTTDDLDEISSLDSDVREEEKKYSSLDGVFSKPTFHLISI